MVLCFSWDTAKSSQHAKLDENPHFKQTFQTKTEKSKWRGLRGGKSVFIKTEEPMLRIGHLIALPLLSHTL